MPTKSKRVQFHKDVKRRRIRKSLSERIKRLNKKESHYRTCHDEGEELPINPNQQIVKVETKNKIFIKRGILNFVQSLNFRMKNKIDFLLFGMVYFDEDALKNQKKDSSLLKSMFNYYSVNSVRITEDFLIVNIHLNFNNIYPVEYVVQRFKNYGQREFYELACLLEKMYNRYASFQGLKTPSMFDHQIDRQLQKSAGKPCMLMIAPATIAFSKQLIKLSGYSMQYMAASCLLNRSFLFDLFLSENYMEEMLSYLSKIDFNAKLRKGQLSIEEYREQTAFFNQNSMIDDSNTRIKVRTKRSNLELGVACWEVESLMGKEKLMQHNHFSLNRERIRFQEQRQLKQLKQINNLLEDSIDKSIKSIKSKEKSPNVCGYKIIEIVKQENL